MNPSTEKKLTWFDKFGITIAVTAAALFAVYLIIAASQYYSAVQRDTKTRLGRSSGNASNATNTLSSTKAAQTNVTESK
jgi:cell division protein FtsL